MISVKGAISALFFAGFIAAILITIYFTILKKDKNYEPKYSYAGKNSFIKLPFIPDKPSQWDVISKSVDNGFGGLAMENKSDCESECELYPVCGAYAWESRKANQKTFEAYAKGVNEKNATGQCRLSEGVYTGVDNDLMMHVPNVDMYYKKNRDYPFKDANMFEDLIYLNNKYADQWPQMFDSDDSNTQNNRSELDRSINFFKDNPERITENVGYIELQLKMLRENVELANTNLVKFELFAQNSAVNAFAKFKKFLDEFKLVLEELKFDAEFIQSYPEYLNVDLGVQEQQFIFIKSNFYAYKKSVDLGFFA
jgi:hypothetical protein